MLIRIAGLTLVMLVATAAAAGAQSFGRNKVHYDDLDFRILETPHFNIYYYPAEHDASVEAGRLAERWYARLSKALDFEFTERQPIVLYASHSQFVQTNVIPGFLGEGTGGVTEFDKGRVVLPFAAGLGETDHVLGHELVHAFQRQILKKSSRSMSALPLWFLEGMAEYLSVGRIDPNTAMWLRDAAEQNKLPRIDQLNDPKWFPYRYGQALWAYLAGRFGEDVVAKCLKSPILKGGGVGRVVSVTGVDAATLSNGWHESIRQMSPSPEVPPRKTSPAIVTSANGGRLNIGPALSPDGKSMVFLSSAISTRSTSISPTRTPAPSGGRSFRWLAIRILKACNSSNRPGPGIRAAAGSRWRRVRAGRRCCRLSTRRTAASRARFRSARSIRSSDRRGRPTANGSPSPRSRAGSAICTK